ncbi:GNAT family N-acetyltransferase [Antarcticibacterium flavum]|uniref:GNAT family N-acetyltransferase n=1 Tax=Antarcticibacterium flavum TaxID=2058175 RepID=A0A5B7X6Z1_9FLAO|nr:MULTISPECIES: GNAT family protein [Antarcticibacterium]MCM4161085.1 GNAT family N-acetyltransferase [Antarcticibacterium sp. W02-3]QCY70488.1 GNAT family N-acetyltransferase [Antarcticibacterium flavum]
MPTLKGNNVILRALEPEDLDFVLEVENTEEFWEISATRVPYSRYLIKKYIQNSHRDIYEVKQLRLMICDLENNPTGMIDIFDLDPKDRKAALGILIAKEDDRRKGFGAEALSLVCAYCFAHLGLHQVYANVTADNEPSNRLFFKNGFIKAGVKKDWVLVNGKFKDEVLYQLINVH